MTTHTACAAIAVTLLSMLTANTAAAQPTQGAMLRKGQTLAIPTGVPMRLVVTRIDGSPPTGGHRPRRGATSHNADGGRNEATAGGMQVAHLNEQHVPTRINVLAGNAPRR